MDNVENVTVDVASAFDLSKQFRAVIPKDAKLGEVELAALLLYTSVARGIGDYPEDSRFARAMLVASDGSKELVRSIKRVGVLTEPQVQFELGRMRV